MHALNAKRQAVLDVAARYRATNIRVFGAVARGDDTAASDVDLLVDMPADASLYDLKEMSMERDKAYGSSQETEKCPR